MTIANKSQVRDYAVCIMNPEKQKNYEVVVSAQSDQQAIHEAIDQLTPILGRSFFDGYIQAEVYDLTITTFH